MRRKQCFCDWHGNRIYEGEDNNRSVSYTEDEDANQIPLSSGEDDPNVPGDIDIYCAAVSADVPPGGRDAGVGIRGQAGGALRAWGRRPGDVGVEHRGHRL